MLTCRPWFPRPSGRELRTPVGFFPASEQVFSRLPPATVLSRLSTILNKGHGAEYLFALWLLGSSSDVAGLNVF